MKKLIAGASILIAGALLFLAASVASSNLGVFEGWGEEGRFWAAVDSNGLTPLVIISVLVMIAGLSIVLSAAFGKAEGDGK
jgi:hypothetical protein